MLTEEEQKARQKISSKKWQKKYKEKIRERRIEIYTHYKETIGPAAFTKRNRKNNLKYYYGITPEDYQMMFDNQKGRCAICDTDIPGGVGNKLHVDHCRITKKIRGLLCSKCNTGIGLLNHDPNLTKLATEYLLRNN